MIKIEEEWTGFNIEKKRILAGAYILTHIESGKFYIGSTNNISNRLRQHKQLLKLNMHTCSGLQELYNNSPRIHVKFFITGSLHDNELSREKAFDIEQELLDEFKNSDLLLNFSKNARVSFLGEKHTEETKKKISEITKERLKDEKYRKASAEYMKNKWSDEDFRNKTLDQLKIARSNIWTEDNRVKINKSRKAFWDNADNKKKILESRNNKKALWSLEKRQKIKETTSKNTKELWSNPEYAKKMRKSIKINGFHYDSILSASKILNIPMSTIRLRANKTDRINYVFAVN